MASIPLIALRTLHYGGRLVLSGQPFKATSDQDARLLKKLGRAKDAGVPHMYQTVSIDPDSETLSGVELGTVTASLGEMPIADEEQPRKKRTYRRRDLTAESPE